MRKATSLICVSFFLGAATETLANNLYVFFAILEGENFHLQCLLCVQN